MKITVRNECPDFTSYRAARVKSLFNVDAGNIFEFEADIPIENRDWQLGVIVGPSGSGKTSIGRKILGAQAFYEPFGWETDQPIIETIAPHAPFDDVAAALAAVGLGSVPAWLRPYSVLSNGERFRADLARIVCERPEKIVIDEFSSVIDRQIARAGAYAFAKAWRRTGGQAVLLSCHYDILDWLQPDWVFDTASGEFTGRWVRQRPAIEIDIKETGWEWWPRFQPHHYLKLPHMIAAQCYVGFVDDEPVVHAAMSTRPGGIEARIARIVVMPEWQGMGIGLRFVNKLCAAWRRGRNRYGKPMPTLLNTSHPGLAAALRRHPLWVQVSANLVGDNKERSRRSIVRSSSSSAATGYGGHFRAVQGFRYIEGV
jgi:ABC-type ATPase with predicted acetyltransferase domain